MSKRTRDSNTMDIDSEPLGPRAAKKKVLEMQAQERAKKEVAAKKREVNKKLRADVDDLSDLFGNMKSSSQEPNVDDLSNMMGNMSTEGKGRRKRRHTRKSKKSKKSKKTRKH
jgi:hypothetical protein